ncbi:MAG: response regulator transcription factor [Anaerolineae bacterium]
MTNTKVLVVDDEPSIVELISAYLRREGYEVLTAKDGPSGFKAARQLKPDVVVLDVMLPGMDGIELLSQLRRYSDVYVILLTAKSDETDKLVGLTVGADDYLTKPFSPRELVARIKVALRRLRASGTTSEVKVLTFGFLMWPGTWPQVNWTNWLNWHLASTRWPPVWNRLRLCVGN